MFAMNRQACFAAVHDVSMIAFGDVSNISAHVLNPMIQHDATCLCLICGNSASCRDASVTKNSFQAHAMYSLLAAATSSDLDLKSTKSDKLRMLVLLNADKALANTKQTLMRFAADLTLHVGYSIQHTATKDQKSQFHVLCVFFVDCARDDACKHWLREMLLSSDRMVIVAPESAVVFMNETFADCNANNAVSFIYFDDLQFCINVLVHASMTTKHRLTLADIARVDIDQKLHIVDTQRNKYLFF